MIPPAWQLTYHARPWSLNGRMRAENVSGPGAIGVAPDLTSTCLGGADMPDATCSIDGCNRRAKARGWCMKHYKRWYLHGNPQYVAPPVDRGALFWAKVDKSDPEGCWLWTGALSDGYGSFGIEGHRTKGAHRYAYETLVGPVPSGLQLDHLCRVRNCVNPDHLEPVTQRENLLRSEGAAARNARKTHCENGHPFDDENTSSTNGKRRCRACGRESEQRRRADV